MEKLTGFPFLETHAHLNGSIPSHAIKELLAIKSKEPGNADLLSASFHLPTPEDLVSSFEISDFFPLFGSFIYRLTNDSTSIRYATLSVLRYFKDEGCIYLELRTTPREVKETGLTMARYLDAVRKGFENFRTEEGSEVMLAKLILSVDRRHSVEMPDKVVDLAIKNRDLVVGLDLCGDPTKGDAREIPSTFKRAKQNGLKITVHLGELPSQLETQDSDFLLQPDRLGHATHLSEATQRIVTSTHLPIEICLTSNLICKTVPSLTAHHFVWAVKNLVPVLICTDDALIFHTTPIKEYELALSLCGDDVKELGRVVLTGVDALFCSDEEKVWVRSRIEAWLESIE